ncbi:MAG: hypothetical protein KAX25_03875 [Dehalococcoidia bacterium]|nr:hypothetical protein [Dehalococcoidia bacterium]
MCGGAEGQQSLLADTEDGRGTQREILRGVEHRAARLEQEGHVIDAGKGKKPPRVRDFERYLME